jgi:3,4-dihydroxy 2-butanone 4-phosphate synthase/GTP cyclohydrolase II
VVPWRVIDGPATAATTLRPARQKQWREIGLGDQILKDLGISSIRLLTSAEHRYVGLAGFGIRSRGMSRSGRGLIRFEEKRAKTIT